MNDFSENSLIPKNSNKIIGHFYIDFFIKLNEKSIFIFLQGQSKI